ncbi:hypothetical protein AURDEDRAFT_144660 [Auricularia subglabra TFB-10046 SS5]|nr:hypothetical protein AURDEDRAFT_144660 [Auricularia subglabra TFB-10046 SS5]
MKTAASTTILALALAVTASARPFVPILARMPARIPTEFYARDSATLPSLAAQAKELNTKFDGLRLADACTTGEKACVQGTSATCVDGQWDGDDCPNGMRCFALPNLSQNAVVLTCTSKTDAKSRIDAAAGAASPMEAAADGECPDETDAPSSTDGSAPSSTDAGAPAYTPTAAPAGAGGADNDNDDDEDCPAENDDDNNDAGAGAQGADDSCDEDNDDAPSTTTVVPSSSDAAGSAGIPVATAPSSDAPLPTTDAPLPTTTDAPLPTTTAAPEPIETVTSVVIILPPQTLGGSRTTTTLTPQEASAVLSSLGLSTGLHTSTTLVQPSQTPVPVDGGYDYPESGTTTTGAPASTATAAGDDGEFITPILSVPGASEGAASSATVSGAPPLVTIV